MTSSICHLGVRSLGSQRTRREERDGGREDGRVNGWQVGKEGREDRWKDDVYRRKTTRSYGDKGWQVEQLWLKGCVEDRRSEM